MPVMILDVPLECWNEVVTQSVMYGLDMSPDNHRNGNTVVEVCGSWEKLQQVLTRIKLKGPKFPDLLAVMESKQINTV